MDEEERLKVLEKLQQDEEEFFANLKPSKYQDGWNEETWEKEMEEHPLFATKLPDSADLPPLVEAMQQLKYDAELNGPEAQKAKTEGRACEIIEADIIQRLGDICISMPSISLNKNEIKYLNVMQ